MKANSSRNLLIMQNQTTLTVGKTDFTQHSTAYQGIWRFVLAHYIGFELEVIPDLKKTLLNSSQNWFRKRKEGDLILKKIISDEFSLLDEPERSYGSVEFLKLFRKKMNSGFKSSWFLSLVGHYGFSEAVLPTGGMLKILSQKWLSHQMIRPFSSNKALPSITILRK